MGARAVLECVLIGAWGLGIGACELLPRAGDTQGDQGAGRWDWYGRLRVDTARRYTLIRLGVDTVPPDSGRPRSDVLLARFDFDPSEGAGDEYALTIGLEIGDARRLRQNHAYELGREIPAYATVTCLCRPLRPDSVRGTYTMQTRGSRHIAGRIDATLHFSAWDDATVHATYRLQQRIHGVRP